MAKKSGETARALLNVSGRSWELHAETVDAEASEQHSVLGRLATLQGQLGFVDEGAQVSLLASSKHRGRALVKQVAGVLFVLRSVDGETLAFVPQQLQRQR